MFFRKKKEANHLSDLQLIERYKESGNNFYVGELFKRYSHLVYGVCLKYLKNPEESRDASMNIFEKLMQDLLKHEVANFKAWLHTVARNHCLMQLRKKDQPLDIDEMEETLRLPVEYQYTAHLEEVPGEMEKNLTEGLNHLNEEQKICIELFYLQDKCYQEISTITGFSMNQVKSYIQNGKRNLKIFLTERNGTTNL